MSLHLTKIAYGCDSLALLDARLSARGDEARLTTRYRPKREAEMIGGSLYWIIAHRIVARSPILRFDEAEGGRTDIVIAARTIPVLPRPRRAHQGWRYLPDSDAPPDLAGMDSGIEELPAEMREELGALGLV
ncbi:MAG: DUF1489 domain-containing protein [Sphingopyxis sp.]|nr:DUF1489 domain-containing protein [Sphingopyxis sp.]